MSKQTCLLTAHSQISFLGQLRFQLPPLPVSLPACCPSHPLPAPAHDCFLNAAMSCSLNTQVSSPPAYRLCSAPVSITPYTQNRGLYHSVPVSTGFSQSSDIPHAWSPWDSDTSDIHHPSLSRVAALGTVYRGLWWSLTWQWSCLAGDGYQINVLSTCHLNNVLC